MKQPTSIGPYSLVKELGRGGMGAVHHARTPDGRDVAIKVLLAGGKQAAFDRFSRERRLQGAFGEAEGFVPLLDGGDSPQGPYIVMPLLPGGTLRSRLEGGPLPFDEAADILTQIARAVGRAHAGGIIHRDLKPENVLFTADGRPLVADLGLAKHFRSDVDGASQSIALTKTGEFRGTVYYTAPEQIRDAKHAGPPADVFALGAILYECVSGKPAFTGGSGLEIMARVEMAQFEPLGKVAKGAPRWLVAVVDKALARDPAQRYADGNALADALEERDANLPPPSRTGAVALVFGGAVLVTAVICGVLLLGGKRGQARQVADPRAEDGPAPPAPAPAPGSPPTPAPAALVVPPSPEVERAEKLAAAGDRAGALAAWIAALDAERRHKPETVRGAWLAAAALVEEKIAGGATTTEPLKKVRNLVSGDEPPEVVRTRARVELLHLLPRGDSKPSEAELQRREVKVRELLVRERGAARGLAFLAPALDELAVTRIMRLDTPDTNMIHAALSEARVHALAAQDAQPGRHVPEVYKNYVSRWTMWGPLDVLTASTTYGATPGALLKAPLRAKWVDACQNARAARLLQRMATRDKDDRLKSLAIERAATARAAIDQLMKTAGAGDDPALLDALARVNVVEGNVEAALVAAERAIAAVPSWETLLEVSRLRAARGELDLAFEEADVAVRALEYESLVPGLDARAILRGRRRCIAFAYRQRAEMNRARGAPEAKDDERLAREAEAEAEKLRLPTLDVD